MFEKFILVLEYNDKRSKKGFLYLLISISVLHVLKFILQYMREQGMNYNQDIVVLYFCCFRVFCIIVFIIDQSYQLAFILGCFWLIGTTFDCYGLPHTIPFF